MSGSCLGGREGQQALVILQWRQRVGDRQVWWETGRCDGRQAVGERQAYVMGGQAVGERQADVMGGRQWVRDRQM